jgi:replicative DNA helicase
MSARLAEVALVQHLSDDKSMAYLVREGLDGELIATETLREIVGFALAYFAQTGYRTAPTVAVLRDTWGDQLDHHEIDLDDEPEGSIEWAIEELKNSYVFAQASGWAKDFIIGVTNAEHGRRPDALAEHAEKLLRISNDLDSRVYRSAAATGVEAALRLYEDRAGSSEIRGLRMGFDVIDAHIMGIHPSELAILAAGPKTGKSFALAYMALTEWQHGRNVMLFTLENSIQMTWDRIACMATGSSYRDWQAGQSSEADIMRVRQWLEALRERDNIFIVAQPPPGRRSFDAMIGEARVHRVDSVLIDQLTFVEMPDPRKAKTERIGDALHRLKAQISSGHDPLSCVVAHQINREGVKAADKVGHLEMYHLADSAEIERTADFVFGVYANREDKHVDRAKFQILAARRTELKNWHMTWNINLGTYRARSEFLITHT